MEQRSTSRSKALPLAQVSLHVTIWYNGHITATLHQSNNLHFATRGRQESSLLELRTPAQRAALPAEAVVVRKLDNFRTTFFLWQMTRPCFLYLIRRLQKKSHYFWFWAHASPLGNGGFLLYHFLNNIIYHRRVRTALCATLLLCSFQSEDLLHNAPFPHIHTHTQTSKLSAADSDDDNKVLETFTVYLGKAEVEKKM